MPLNEADTRAKLIDPALHARGWTEDLIKREESAGAIQIVDGAPRKQAKGRTDYTLRVKVNFGTQPVAVALIEAKAESLPPNHGLEQGKLYAASKRLNVPFVYASNGHLFVEYDHISGRTSPPRPLADFPTPADLRARYEAAVGFSLADDAARPLLAPYPLGEAGRRYYQDAAIRAVFEKLARCRRAGESPRALLSLATGAGKTFIAVNLLRRIADAGQLRRALFVCDRDELRNQATAAFTNLFGANAAPVSSGNPQRNARVLIATYQTLDVDQEAADANFLTANYPENYFSHIVIDECHRSAWGKWSQVLTRNPDAVQIGLTATPRQLQVSEHTPEAEQDARLTADNIRHFGEPVYEYDLGQGIEDGYLAACEIVRRDIFLQGKSEREYGLSRDDLAGTRLTDALTGEILTNPPFGGKEGPEAQTNFAYKTSATQVLFLQHVIDHLKPGGRCGIVLDEGVLFRTNEAAFLQTKRKLLDDCDLWCIVSLPAGVFTAAGAGVKTNLLFFTRGQPTQQVWYYDLSDLKVGKRTPLTLDHFKDFFALLPTRPNSPRSWTVTRQQIEANTYDLKAVNPTARATEDTRTPEELLNLIESKGREVAEALAQLRAHSPAQR